MTIISKPSARWPAMAILQMEGINALSQYWRTFTLCNPCQSSDVYNKRYKKLEPPRWAALGYARCFDNHLPNGLRLLPNNQGKEQVGQDKCQSAEVLHHQKPDVANVGEIIHQLAKPVKLLPPVYVPTCPLAYFSTS